MSESPPSLALIAIRQVEKSTGASRNALEQTSALIALGYRVVIIAERGRADLVERAGAQLVLTRRWPFKGPFRRFWFNRRVQAWARRHRPALLVSHGDVETPDVVYLHNCVHLANQAIYGRPLPTGHEVAAIHDHVLGGRRFRRVAVNSRLMAHDLASRYGIDESAIEISYPGYDPAQFNPQRARPRREQQRLALGVGDDEWLIGLVTSGNFRKRNVAGLVRMAAGIEHRLPGRCRFLVVGRDDPAPYQRQAVSLNVAERFIWRSTIDDVESLYGALDLFVLPAHIEEFGRVALEAMACATPVLLSSSVGSAEVLEGRHAELILKADDDAGWVERIVELLGDAPRREEIGMALAHRVTDWSHERQRNRLMASFESLQASKESS
ncbi:glycosyltransferase family 4 protein [Kushneria aurantia]|uniref:Glycosyltransferase family 4 protein n=1 Tax=Kushneria aurantia TaxID=504092 RepID=A0ABV6G4H9_9GAMM|nr:glycosyltransferase family 4 protein [Kushneria aurantia]